MRVWHFGPRKHLQVVNDAVAHQKGADGGDLTRTDEAKVGATCHGPTMYLISISCEVGALSTDDVCLFFLVGLASQSLFHSFLRHKLAGSYDLDLCDGRNLRQLSYPIALLFPPALFTTLVRCASLVSLMTHHSPLTGQATNQGSHWRPSNITCNSNLL